MLFKNSLEKVLTTVLFSDSVDTKEVTEFIVDFYKKYETDIDKKIIEIINDPSFPKEDIKEKYFSENKKVLNKD